MRVSSLLFRTCVLVLLGGPPALLADTDQASLSILHAFQGTAARLPQAWLTSDGHGNLYGTTALEGPSNGGTVFKIRSDGTGFQVLHAFINNGFDGLYPQGALTLDGSGNLYGVTSSGGLQANGIVFTIKVDGSGFQILHSFAGGPGDGSYPYASLILDVLGNLYGTTSAGGLHGITDPRGATSSFGTVFKLRTDGTGFQLLHSFAGGAGDGRGPWASLLLDGSGNLYGTTILGGEACEPYCLSDVKLGRGTIFRIKTDGSGFQLLRAFPFDVEDAGTPSGALSTDGSGNLYGMTAFGGSSNDGSVFKLRTDGSGFQVLHSFGDSPVDGKNPVDSLVLDRSGNLYGMTQGQGTAGALATIFKVRTDASGYQLLRTFVDTREGITPAGSLILDGSEILYGTMAYGGSSNAGTVFSLHTDGSSFQALHTLAGSPTDGGRPFVSVISDGSGYLYGTTIDGGVSLRGTVFRVRSDGTGFQLLHVFRGGPNDGDAPRAPLILDRAGIFTERHSTEVRGATGPSSR